VGQTYTAGTAPTISVTSPSNNSRVWLAGSDHTVTCAASDIDECTSTTAEVFDVDDSLTIWWTGSGTFKNGQNIGTSVTYVCRNTAGTDTIVAHGDDNKPADAAAAAADANSALFDEDAVTSTRTVAVIIPVLNTLEYKTGSFTISDVTKPEYNRTGPARNDPGAFKQNTSPNCTAESKFWNATSLTNGSDVTVKGFTTGTDMNHWLAANGTFGTTWPSAAFTHDGGPIISKVKKATYDTEWKYKVPSGSDTYITMNTQASCIAYIVLDTPHVYGGAGNEEAKQVFDYSCVWADNVTAAQGKEEVCNKIKDGIAANYNYGGTCLKEASNFARLVGVQGVTATVHRWDIAATPVAGNIDRMQTRTITLIGTPYNGYPAGANRITWTNYHAWATAEGNNWDCSANTKHAGGWTDYEDWVFNNGGTDDYRVKGTPNTWIANPAGQGTETGAAHGMTHSTPSPSAFVAP
jgi:hypothetical protein